MIEFYRKPPTTPWWFIVVLVIVALPTFTFIPQASHIVEEAEWLGTGSVGWIYTLCIALSCLCAWTCYPTRRTIAWILAAVVALIDIAMFISVCLTPAPSA